MSFLYVCVVLIIFNKLLFKPTLSPIELKLDGRHHSDTDSKLLKSFHIDIQDGRHGCHLEILQIAELKLDGRHHSDTEIQNC